MLDLIFTPCYYDFTDICKIVRRVGKLSSYHDACRQSRKNCGLVNLRHRNVTVAVSQFRVKLYCYAGYVPALSLKDQVWLYEES